MKHTILCIDDELDNVEALERLFRKKYKVLKGISAAEGLEHLKRCSENQAEGRVSLIISDQRMPEKTGVQFLKESIEHAPEAIRILLTGYTDIESVIDAINSGQVYRYITKPWDPVDLMNTVDKALEKYELSAELKIKNAELRDALDELKVLDEAKNNFMMLINHELKTPLTVITSFVELLGETPLTEEQEKYLSRITKGSEKLSQLVNDTLVFVSAETGTLKTSKKSTDLNSLLGRIEKDLQTDIESKEQKLIVDGSAKIKTDPKHFEEAVKRLVENAVRFSDIGSEIQIHLDNEALKIKNFGKPISKKIIESLGQSFNLDEDMMKHSKGLGMGLSLSRALFTHLGHDLDFETGKDWTEASVKLTE